MPNRLKLIYLLRWDLLLTCADILLAGPSDNSRSLLEADYVPDKKKSVTFDTRSSAFALGVGKDSIAKADSAAIGAKFGFDKKDYSRSSKFNTYSDATAIAVDGAKVSSSSFAASVFDKSSAKPYSYWG